MNPGTSQRFIDEMESGKMSDAYGELTRQSVSAEEALIKALDVCKTSQKDFVPVLNNGALTSIAFESQLEKQIANGVLQNWKKHHP